MFYRGVPRVEQYFGVEDQTLSTKERVLQVAASMVGGSRQPVLSSLVRAAREATIPLREVDSDQLGDSGLVGKLDRTWYVLGDTATMASEAIELGVAIQALAQQFELDGKFTLFLAQKQPKRLLGIFACAYEPDEAVPAAVQRLRSMGIELVLLTGVKTSIAKGIGTRLNLSLIHSELSSSEKERVLQSLVVQQPASALLGKLSNSAVPHIALGKGAAGSTSLASVPDLVTLATLITESRTLVAAAQRSLLWRNL
jgi:Cu+-exporting ATPase